MTRLRHLVEGATLWLALGLFRLVGIDAASALGGRLGRLVGPLAASKQGVARRNLEACFPGIGEGEVRRITGEMWESLGRFLGEMPHLQDLDVWTSERVELRVAPETDALIHPGVRAIYFNAHYGNWEVPPLVAMQRGVALTIVYRRASNPWSERQIQHWRNRRGPGGHWVPKGRESARALVAALAGDGSAGIMADQKLNEGLPIPFFGRDAMTAPAIAELALKYDVPLVPVRVDRLKGARFRVSVMAPLAVPRSGDRRQDVRAILVAINETFEDWIRERPGQWLWMHRRWPK